MRKCSYSTETREVLGNTSPTPERLLVLHTVCNFWVIYRYCKKICATFTKNVKFVVKFKHLSCFLANSRICAFFCVNFVTTSKHRRVKVLTNIMSGTSLLEHFVALTTSTLQMKTFLLQDQITSFIETDAQSKILSDVYIS